MISKVTQMVGRNGSSNQGGNGYSVLPRLFNSFTNNPGYHGRPYNFAAGNGNNNNINSNNSNINTNSSKSGPVFFSGSGDADDPLVLDDDEDE
ncbi:unnamed protein product [[Candida] boidinii]|nr:unnamed protein product [[Candida] boidinii]